MDRLQSITGGVLDAMGVRRVFGEPVERDGVTVVPVARIWGGFGGGDGGSPDAGLGGGIAFSATPAGVFVIRDGDVRWEPATNADRTVFLGCLVAIVGLLTVRSVARSRVASASGRERPK